MSERKRVDIKAILVDPVLREEIVEGATDFICKVEGIRPHSFSPTAQAVLDACFYQDHPSARHILAAALRAVADHLKTIGPWVGHLESSGLQWSVLEVESIANELESHND